LSNQLKLSNVKNQVLLFGSILLIANQSLAQFHYRKEWDHRFGGTANDQLETFHETSDKGFILGGTSYSNVSGDKSDNSRGQSDYWIVKTDSMGIMQWDKTFGGDNFDDLRDVKETSDGGFIIGGSSRSNATGDKSQPNRDTSPNSPTTDYWIIRTDASGNKLWDKRFGGIYTDILTCISETNDHGFIIGGYSEGNAGGDRTENSRGGPDYWIVKTDASGNKLWDKRYGGNRNDQLWALQQTRDGGYMLGGFSWSDSTGDKSVNNYGLVSYSDFWVVKIDSAGAKQWDNHYGGTSNEYLYSVEQTSDDGYILGGPSWSDSTADKTSNNFGPPNTSDYWIVKITSAGVLQWEKSFGGINHEDEYGNTIQTDDDGYLVSGTSYSNSTGNKTEHNLGLEQSWIVKTDLAGNIQWDKTIFTPGHDEKGLAIQTHDGGYAVANYTNGTIGGYKSELNRDSSNVTYDYWLVKFADSSRVHPVANFFTPARDLCPKTCIDFLNLSLNATSYKWLFPGASPSSSTQVNPSEICYNLPGSYNVTLIASDSLESDTLTMTAYISVFPNPAPLTIIQSHDSLIAPDVFSTYQWSKNGHAIAGANDFFLIISTGGIYDLDITDTNGCAENHEINIIMANITEDKSENAISVFPNPAKEEFTISFENTNHDATISLVNTVGQKVFEKTVAQSSEETAVKIPVQNLAGGMYIINFATNGTVYRKYLVVSQ
jgi:PKD repeat protein